MAFDVVNLTPNALSVDGLLYPPGQSLRVRTISKNLNIAIGQQLMSASPIALPDEYGAAFIDNPVGDDFVVTADIIEQAGGEVAGGGGGAGTVTSVAVSVPSPFTSSGGPITGSGTIAIAVSNQAINTVWAGPASGGAGAPAFRALVAADIPVLDASKITTGTMALARVTGAAGLASPAFTGTPTAPTATAGTNTTQIATTAFVATSYAPLASPALTGTATAVNLTISGNAIFPSSTFASLPSAATAGANARRFITDGAASPVFGAAAAGNGTLLTPVYSNGSTWLNG